MDNETVYQIYGRRFPDRSPNGTREFMPNC